MDSQSEDAGVARHPHPGDKRTLNAQAQAVLAKIGSPLQYYELIDTQWPTEPKAPPTPWTAGLPGAINNKTGGNPTPVYLTNIALETYFQKGVQAACHQEELPRDVPCPPTPWTASLPGAPVADTTPVFGTESCMGCHSSAGFHIAPGKTSGQLTGDFSWLYVTKAK